MPHAAKLKMQAASKLPPPVVEVPHGVCPLTAEDEQEALDFLAGGSVDSIFMSGLIHDNGAESPLNRGVFRAFRGDDGALEGVALVGHATLVEARTRRALEAFARLARSCRTAHVIVGEQEKVESFWSFYRDGGQEPRRICRELLFELRAPVAAREEASALRPATFFDLADVMRVNARMAEDESGVNPLTADPDGFRRRTLRRIEQGRVWVLVEDGRLIFKADVMSETPEFAYLEGVYVNPEDRRAGVGRRCLLQLCRTLLTGAKAVCLLVNEQNKDALAFFFKVGFKLRGCYDTIFLKRV